MRKVRDYDAELKALGDKARALKAKKVQQLGELVTSTGADALDPDMLAGLEGKKLVFMCAMGMRSMQVGTYLLQNDMIDAAYNLAGGIQGWMMSGYPVEQG